MATNPLISEQGLFSGECFICYCPPADPVITMCGHIYCWPCIYTWLNMNRQVLTCPVCKNGISVDELIPIYTRDDQKESNNTNPETENLNQVNNDSQNAYYNY